MNSIAHSQRKVLPRPPIEQLIDTIFSHNQRQLTTLYKMQHFPIAYTFVYENPFRPKCSPPSLSTQVKYRPMHLLFLSNATPSDRNAGAMTAVRPCKNFSFCMAILSKSGSISTSLRPIFISAHLRAENHRRRCGCRLLSLSSPSNQAH